MVAKVIFYKTRNGKVFETQREAQLEEEEVRLGEWADNRGLCRGGEWDQDMVLTAILEDAEIVRDILSEVLALQPNT